MGEVRTYEAGEAVRAEAPAAQEVMLDIGFNAPQSYRDALEDLGRKMLVELRAKSAKAQEEADTKLVEETCTKHYEAAGMKRPKEQKTRTRNSATREMIDFMDQIYTDPNSAINRGDAAMTKLFLFCQSLIMERDEVELELQAWRTRADDLSCLTIRQEMMHQRRQSTTKLPFGRLP